MKLYRLCSIWHHTSISASMERTLELSRRSGDLYR